MITSRTLIASFGAAVAALIAMAWLSLARAGAEAVQAGQGGVDAAIGRALFERLWVGAPACTNAADGLGSISTRGPALPAIGAATRRAR